jgi:hypothetical protein
MLSDQYRPGYGPKPFPRCASRRTWAKRADGTDVLAYRPVRNRPGAMGGRKLAAVLPFALDSGA